MYQNNVWGDGALKPDPTIFDWCSRGYVLCALAHGTAYVTDTAKVDSVVVGTIASLRKSRCTPAGVGRSGDRGVQAVTPGPRQTQAQPNSSNPTPLLQYLSHYVTPATLRQLCEPT